jgi:EmrB/QacA subfamily drug resistance transporter
MDKRVALAIATVASFVTPFMVSAVTIALPSIGSEFSMTAMALGWVATAYLLAAAVSLLPFGALADIHGRKRVFLAGMAVYTGASFLCGIAPAPAFLVACRVAQGLGAAMIFSTSVAIVTSVFPAAERGGALGITVGATYLGLSFGPVLGGLLVQHLGWRSIFFVTVPLGLAVIALIVWKLRGEWAESRGEPFDLAGGLLCAASLAALMYGFTRLPGRAGMALVPAGMLGIAGFILREMRIPHPLLHMDLFARNRVFALSNLAALINYSASNAVTFLVSLYLQYIKALSPQEAGFVLVAQPAVMAAFSPFAGRLSDRVESRIVASIGMALSGAALGAFIFIGAKTSLAAIVLILMLLGFGFALFSSPNMNAIMGSVEKRFYGIASATLATMRMIGQMLSMGIAMLVFALKVGDVRITPERHQGFLTSFRVACIVFTALSVAGVFASLARGSSRRSGEAGVS